jgi:hypothetical protein
MKTSSILMIAAMVGTLVSCKKPDELTMVNYAVANHTSKNIREVSTKIGDGHQFSLGIVIPETSKSFSGGIPIDEDNELIISWISGSGEQRVRNLRVTKEELTDEREIRFEIHPDQSVTRGWRFEDSP